MAPHENNSQPTDPRVRAPVTLVCDVRQGQRPLQRVRLRNISPGGFCMEWMPGLEVNRPLWIRIAGLNLIQANIRWRDGSMVGCEFSAPLYPPIFDHIVLQANLAG